MKKIYLLLFCFSYLSLNGQNTWLKLKKVKINSSIKGYLFDIDEDKVILVPKKKLVKKFLLSGNCENCYAISTDYIWSLNYPQKKSFLPIGLMASVGLGSLLIAAADNTPNPDGLNGRNIAGIYAFGGVLLGGATDLVRLIGHFDGKNTADTNVGIHDLLQSKTAIYQFNEIRNNQLKTLSGILAKIERYKTNYQRQIKIYTKDKKLIKGYILGQQKGTLLLRPNKNRIVEYRYKSPNDCMKIPLKNIFYYEFN